MKLIDKEKFIEYKIRYISYKGSGSSIKSYS